MADKMLLEQELEQLHQWFARVYPQYQLDTHVKKDKTGEYYVFDLHHKRDRAIRYHLREDWLLDIEMRKLAKDKALEGWQRAIIAEIA